MECQHCYALLRLPKGTRIWCSTLCSSDGRSSNNRIGKNSRSCRPPDAPFPRSVLIAAVALAKSIRVASASPRSRFGLQQFSLRSTSRVNPLRLPLSHVIGVDPVLSILSLFLLAALLALFAAIAHTRSSLQYKNQVRRAINHDIVVVTELIDPNRSKRKSTESNNLLAVKISASYYSGVAVRQL